jgi:hypothetical protein
MQAHAIDFDEMPDRRIRALGFPRALMNESGRRQSGGRA